MAKYADVSNHSDDPATESESQKLNESCRAEYNSQDFSDEGDDLTVDGSKPCF